MKKIFIFFVCVVYCQTISGQSISLSYPIANSVLQRNSSNNATAYIAGQLTSSSALPPGAYIGYRIKTLNGSGGVISTSGITNVTVLNNGLFYTYQSFSKGWYLIEIFYNGLVYAATKFGVGDVFIVAGQSNAQGVGDVSNSWQLPSVSGFPEWLVASNYDGNCTKNLPEAYSLSMYSISDYNNRFNRLGPTGNNVWCYAALGKLISDANSGMPVAFFNAASGGSTITTWYQGAQGVAAPNGYVGGNQFCLGYNGGSTNPTDYYGQPYTPFNGSSIFKLLKRRVSFGYLISQY